MTGRAMIFFVLCSAFCLAQEGQHTPQQQLGIDVRRFVFTMSELEQGRKLNTRSFEVLCRADNHCSLKTGSRIPASVGTKENPGSWQYMDVGLNAHTHYHLRPDGKIEADFTVDMSNIASAKPQDAATNQAALPVVRQTHNDVNTVLTPNILTSIASVEDLNSGHTYELSVIAKDK